jgi:hypothetical protein
VTTQPCPTPWKIVYVSRRHAHTVIRNASKSGTQQNPYKCVCGNWHTSHLSKRQAKLARQGRGIA